MKKEIKKERMISQDIAKGLAILLVTLVHSVKVNNIVGSAIAVLFGYIMPFFMFMSGYNYNDRDQSIKANLKRRVLKLLIPFFITTTIIFILMGTYFYFVEDYSILEIAKSYLGFLVSKWGMNLIGLEWNQVLFQRVLGPCWFIQFLIIADLIFIPVHHYTKNDNKKLFVSITALSLISVLLIRLGISLPWGIQNSFALAGLFLIANYIKRNDLLFKTKSKKYTIINCIICVITIAVIQLLDNGAGYLGAGELGSVLGGMEVYILYLIAVIGSYLIINICKLIEKNKHLTKIFTNLGQNTFLILMIHMSIVHIVKHLFKLNQWNAADGLFGTFYYKELLVYPLILVLVMITVYLYKKLLGKLLKNTF